MLVVFSFYFYLRHNLDILLIVVDDENVYLFICSFSSIMCFCTGISLND